MSEDILIGIDLGTTALKVAAFGTRSATCRATASRRLAVRTAPDGTREQDTAAIRQALTESLEALRLELGSDWARIAGLGLAAQGGSGAIVDRDAATAHTPMMLWNDGRSARQLTDVAASRPAGYWEKLAWRVGPGHGLGRLRWLREHRPALFTSGNLYVGVGEYVYFLLTGVWRQDACNALQTGCYSVPDERLDAEPLDIVGVPLDFVAPLRAGHETHPLGAEAGRSLELPVGVPVAGPYIDHEAGYLSAAAVSARPLQCSLGTAWVGNFVISRDAEGGSPVQLVIPSPIGNGRLVILPLLTGNVTWDWGLTSLVDPDHGRALRKLDEIFAAEILPPDGLIALPWFTQANTLARESLGAGCFFGLNTHTSSHELLRALAAGLAYEFARVFAELPGSGLVDSVVLGGGASRAGFFRQLLAALLAPLPVFSLRGQELAGARGTLYAIDAAVSRADPVPEEVPDEPLAERVRRGFTHYVHLFEQLYGDSPFGGGYRVAPSG